jgi:protein-S-isoprenylcysteine O-methyltransferase Ste14
MVNKLYVCLGVFMVIFASSMQDTINNPMPNSVFAIQILLILAGLVIAVYGGYKSR